MESLRAPTLAEFLVWENAQDGKHEYADGEVIAFAGGTNRHNLIAANVISGLRTTLRAGCRATGSDTKIIGSSWSRYPDVVVTCDERDTLDLAHVAHPTLIAEVLSEGTHGIDREDKLDEYRSLSSLREYLLVDSRRRWIQIVRRSGDEWVVSLPIREEAVHCPSLDITLSLDEIYAGTGL